MEIILMLSDLGEFSLLMMLCTLVVGLVLLRVVNYFSIPTLTDVVEMGYAGENAIPTLTDIVDA